MGKYTVAGIRPDMDAVPPDCPVELISLMKAGVFFSKSQGPKVEVVLQTMDEMM